MIVLHQSNIINHNPPANPPFCWFVVEQRIYKAAMSPKTPASPAALNATAPVALGAAAFDVPEDALPFAVEEPVPVAPALVVVAPLPVVAAVVATVAPQLGAVKVPSALSIAAEWATYHDKKAWS